MFNISHPQKIIRNENVKIRKWRCLILDFSQFVHEKSQNISRNAMQNIAVDIYFYIYTAYYTFHPILCPRLSYHI